MRFDMTLYDMIYMLTAIGQPPGGSSTVHIYKQYRECHKTINTQNNTKIHRTTQKIHRTTQKLGRVRAVPRLCGFYAGIEHRACSGKPSIHRTTQKKYIEQTKN